MLSIYLQSVVGDPAVVDDLFQETLLVAWRNLDRFDKKRSFGKWVRGIAGKLILAHRRRGGSSHVLCSEKVLEAIDARCEALHRQPGDTLNEKLDALRDCVERLPPRYNEAIQMRYANGFKGSGLANALRTSAENAKKLVQRGRSLLTQCMHRALSIEDSGHDERTSAPA